MPRIKLNKSNIETISFPQTGQKIYCDQDIPGFYLIVGSQSKTFVVQKDIRGRSVRYTIGKLGHFTPEEARRIAKEKLYLMATGVNPNDQDKKEERTLVTLDIAFESYLKSRKSLKQQTREAYQYLLNRHLDSWKSKDITLITKDMVGQKHRLIADSNGPSTANMVMRLLRALLNFAHASFDICANNPVKYLTHVKAWYKETRRRTYIKPADLKVWWRAINELENKTYRDYLLMLLFTGLRRNEAAKLKWSDVSFAERTLTIADTKNGDPLVLPLSSFLLSLLEQRRKQTGNYEFVFPGPGKAGFLTEPKKGIQIVTQQCGVKFTCHDLRRTFITIAESMDVGTYSLKRLINHRVTDVTGGYIIVDAERLRGPVEKIAQFILESAHGMARS